MAAASGRQAQRSENVERPQTGKTTTSHVAPANKQHYKNPSPPEVELVVLTCLNVEMY